MDRTLKVRLGSGLLLIGLLTGILIPLVVLASSTTARVFLGLPFLLFFPGYTLLLAIFPKRDIISGTERVALSFGTSIAVVAFLGLANNYRPWGITEISSLISVSAFILITSIAAWYRLHRLAKRDRLNISFSLGFPWKGQSILDRALSVALTVVVLGTIGTLAWTVAFPRAEEKFTEFYILGQEGQMVNYPTELEVGEKGKVLLGIINQEQKRTEYWIIVSTNGIRRTWIGPIDLDHKEVWEREAEFTLTKAGNNQKVEFSLFGGSISPKEDILHLWVTVESNSTAQR